MIEAKYGKLEAFSLDSVEVDGDEVYAKVTCRMSTQADYVDIKIDTVAVGRSLGSGWTRRSSVEPLLGDPSAHRLVFQRVCGRNRRADRRTVGHPPRAAVGAGVRRDGRLTSGGPLAPPG